MAASFKIGLNKIKNIRKSSGEVLALDASYSNKTGCEQNTFDDGPTWLIAIVCNLRKQYFNEHV